MAHVARSLVLIGVTGSMLAAALAVASSSSTGTQDPPRGDDRGRSQAVAESSQPDGNNLGAEAIEMAAASPAVEVAVVSPTIEIAATAPALEVPAALPAIEVVTASPAVEVATSAPVRQAASNLWDDPAAAASPVEQWLERLGVARVMPAVAEPDERVAASPGHLERGNFPISNFADAVSTTESLDGSTAAWDSLRGQYLVVWHALSRARSYNIYGRFVSGTGTLQGGAFVIADAAGMQIAPSIAYDAARDGYWVAFTDFGGGSVGSVKLRRLSAAGVMIGGEITASGIGGNAYAARLTVGGGRCWVAWASEPGDGNSHILVRGYDGLGNPTSPGLLLSEAYGKATEPDLAYDGSDQHIMVVWHESRTSSGWDVVAYRLNYDLYSLGRMTVSAALANQVSARVAYCAAAGRYLVVWQDGRSQTSWDVWGQLVDRNGALAGGALGLFAGAYHDIAPVVAGHGTASQFAVAFQRDISGAGQFQIYGCLVGGTGSVSREIQIREWYNARSRPGLVFRTGFNEFLTTFTDDAMGTQADIMAQALRSDGLVVGFLITVSRGRKGQEAPTVAYNPVHNEYLTVWADYRTGSDYDLFLRRVAANGDLIGSEMVVAMDAALYGDPDLATNPGRDESLVVWQEVHSPSTGFDIYARRAGYAGGLQGAPLLISRDTATFNEGRARAVYNPVSDEYLVIWHAFTNGQWRIWAQRVSPVGALIGSNVLIGSGSGTAQNPKVAHHRTRNEYLVVWQDLRNGGRVDVYGQRLTAAVVPLGVNFPVSTAAGNKDGCDVASSDTANDYLVVWGDARTGGNDVWGQRLSATGGFVGGDFPIATLAVGETAPVVIWDPATHEYLVAYWVFDPATDWDVWARWIPATGLPAEPTFAVSTAAETQTRVRIAHNSTNGDALFVWQDFRADSYDIYGQRWSHDPITPTGPRPRRHLGPR